jgi:hypothetical protein
VTSSPAAPQRYLLGRPVPPAELRAVLDGFDEGLLDGVRLDPEAADLDAGVHIVGRVG